jgi:tetratricopeptide (TPR) repeat protein
MTTTSKLVLALLLVLGFSQAATAQTIILKNGQTVEVQGIRRSGDMVMGRIEVAGRAGEIGHAVDTIARINFPEPRQLKAAAEALSQGQAQKAIEEINPVMGLYEPFKEIPGAWWGAAAVIKLSALAALGRDKEAEPLAAEIQKTVPDPEVARSANLRVADSLLRRDDHEKAGQIIDAVIKDSTRAEVLADAWVLKGNLLMARKEWDGALLAYLHVPVFYRDERLHMPPALLGSARAYRRLDDPARAKRSLNDLIASFPKSAEAAVAQTELQKLPK